MNKSFKKFLKYYLVIGVIWGLFARFPNGLELNGYSEGRSYQNRVTSVTNSYITSLGNLTLCMEGRLAYSRRYPSDITGFSISIPLNKIISQKTYKDENIDFTDLDSNVIELPYKVINKKCNEVQGTANIQVKLAEYTPLKAFYFSSVKDLKDIRPDDNEDLMIFIVPFVNTYPKPHFMEMKRIFIIMKSPDVLNRHHYIVSLKDTWINRDIGIGEYFVAFLKDALFYPVWMVMMVSW